MQMRWKLPLFLLDGQDPASYEPLVLLRQSQSPPDTAVIGMASSLKYSWISDLSLCADTLCEGNTVLHLSAPIQKMSELSMLTEIAVVPSAGLWWPGARPAALPWLSPGLFCFARTTFLLSR